MNKRYIFGIILFILIFSLIGYFYYYHSKPYLTNFKLKDIENTGSSAKSASDCSSMLNTDLQTNCYKDLALEKRDISICNLIINNISKEYCYSNVAEVKQDISLCALIYSQYIKNGCYSKIGIAKADLNICDLATEKVGEGTYDPATFNCVQKVASILKDISLCKKYPENSEKWNNCYMGTASGKKDVSICDSMSEVKDYQPYYQDNCYLLVAISKQDASICNKISSKFLGGINVKEVCNTIK